MFLPGKVLPDCTACVYSWESLLTALCKQVLLKQRTPIYRMVFARGALLHETESA